MFKGIFGRLLLTSLGVILIITAILLLLLSYTYTNFYTAEKEKRLTTAGKEITNLAERYLQGEIAKSDLTDKLKGTAHKHDSEISIFPLETNLGIEKNAEGLKRFTTHLTNDYFSSTDIARVLAGETVSKVTPEPEINLMSVAVPLKFEGKVIGGVSLHSPMYDVTAASARLYRLSAVIIVIAALVAIILAYFFSDYFSRPLQQMSRAALQIAQGNFSEKVTVKTKDELGALADSFNHMAGQLAKVEKTRRELIANISHELRTPMSFISGVLQGVNDATFSDRDREKYVTLALSEIERVNGLINDMLDLARLEHGDVKLERQKVNVQELILEVLAEKEPDFLQKKLEPHLHFKEDPYVLADPNRVKQMIINLLDNAIKFSGQHSLIQVGVDIADGMAEVWIKDFGPGIPEEEQEYIWDRFYKVDKTRKPEQGGSGLGLAITKMLAYAHNGTVGVKSEIGQGSTFYFMLPLWQAEERWC